MRGFASMCGSIAQVAVFATISCPSCISSSHQANNAGILTLLSCVFDLNIFFCKYPCFRPIKVEFDIRHFQRETSEFQGIFAEENVEVKGTGQQGNMINLLNFSAVCLKQCLVRTRSTWFCRLEIPFPAVFLAMFYYKIRP